MASALTSTGLEKATEEELNQEVKSDLWSNISDQINLSSAAPLGNIVGIFCERLAELWDLAEAVLNARKPDTASDAALTALSLLTGTERREATKTQVTVTVNLDDGFSQAAGTMFAHKDGDPTARYTNKALVENSSGITANVDAEFEAETAGALEILSGDLTVIAENITGWNSVTNALDGETGFANESDLALRIRRDDELEAQGASTVDSIRADILDPDVGLGDNITHCRVLENDTDSTDSNSLPPHSVEVIAKGISTNAANSTRLAEFILDAKSAGIQAYGTSSEAVLDSQGNSHDIGYTWVSSTNIYFEIDIVIDEDAFPLDGDDQVIDAILAIEETYEPGDDIIAERIKAAAFTVEGVTDVSALRLGTTVSPVGTSNISIGIRAIGAFDSSRIEVAHV